MNSTQMIRLEQDIACGKYDCLKSCCSEASLLTIWQLMRGLGQDDVHRLAIMLCGCQVTTAPNAAGGQLPTGPLAVPEVNAQANCLDRLTSFFCDSQPAMRSLRLVCEGLAIAYPDYAGVLASLIADLKDFESRCGSTDRARLGLAMAKVCSLDTWLSDALQRTLPDAIAEFINSARHWVHPVSLFVGKCCESAQPATDRPEWPTSTKPEVVEVPATTTPVSYSGSKADSESESNPVLL